MLRAVCAPCVYTHCCSGLTTVTIGTSSKCPIVFLGVALPRVSGFRKASLPSRNEVSQAGLALWAHVLQPRKAPDLVWCPS